MNDIHKEKAFEDQIVKHLRTHGWKPGLDADFDPKLAIDRGHLLGFIADSQTELWERLSKQYGAQLGDLIIRDLVSMAESQGLLHLLRHGLDFRGSTIRLAYFKPAFGLNPDQVRKYEANRLLVYRQVRYEVDRDERDQAKSIDLMLALNGLPIATAELKNPATGQTVRHAMKQYRETRDPRAPLFKFKRRALVHFAVDPNLVYMATRLAWEDTRFLPFNKGHLNGAGNPPNPNGHRTAYLWEEVWQRDGLLEILGRFVHVEKDARSGSEVLIFPRYHQLDVVRRLVTSARSDGPGERYLVQHSTGSGKSKSIGWLAHRLYSLHREVDGEERKVFDQVVVVTDRKVLDRQLQDTIWQIDRTPGVVKRIDKNAKQLAEALQSGVASILVTTLQKFPFARIAGALDDLPERSYAIIADEAHSSQTGETSYEMRRTLGSGVKDSDVGYQRLGDDVEDEIVKVMQARQQQENLSFFGFTATPKGKTLKAFGEPRPDGSFAPFHLYSMRQAIEEKFILDVLANYVTYGTYLELKKSVDEDPELEEKAAAKALSHFHRHHPEVIRRKLTVMVDHFRQHKAAKIEGRAKAMIVTSSREAAVRYRLAFDTLVQQKGYEDLKALVAFSGTVKLDEGGEYTEPGMNSIKEAELKETFRESAEHRFLIVADKYQTGYDEPLLHTMYVDKKLADVAAVQTLSRLNRTKRGKTDTFVLDFVNKPEEIQVAFQPFYERTITKGGADHTDLYRLRHELEGMRVFEWSEVEAFAKDFYVARKRVTKKQHGKWVRHLQPAVDRFKELADAKEKEKFRTRLRAYVNLYAFLSQIMGFPARDLEILYGFGRFLLAELPRDESGGVDVDDKVDLDNLIIETKHSGAIGLVKGEEGETSSPSGAVGTGSADDKRSPLSEIIDKINERIGARFGGAPAHLMEAAIESLTDDENVGERALANKYEDFEIASDVRGAVDRSIVENHGDNGEFLVAYLNDEEGIKHLVTEGILREVYRRVRERDARERGIDPELLADIGKLRNRLEPKLRRLVKRALKMHRGDAWIREVLKVFPEARRKQAEGIDADTILREHTYLRDLVTIIHGRWNEYFKAFEAGSPKLRLSRAQVEVLLDYINTHREDAHAGALEEGELATLKIAVTALERAVDRQLED